MFILSRDEGTTRDCTKHDIEVYIYNNKIGNNSNNNINGYKDTTLIYTTLITCVPRKKCQITFIK